MRKFKFLTVLLLALPAAFLAACGGQVSSVLPTPGQRTGTVFTIGTDNPPLPSVLSFQIMITGVTLSDGTTTANLLTQPQSVDFARFNGLNTLLDLNSVPVGNYTSTTITLSSPVLGYLDTSVSPPVIKTVDGTLTASQVTVKLSRPLVVDDSDLVGLFLDFDLRQSIQVDSSGNITGTINPTFDARAISAEDAEARIDELRGGVVSVDPAGNSFVMQGPQGRQFTVVTSSQTDFDTGDDLSGFDTNTIVEVSGKLNRVTRNIDASEVEVVSKKRFFLGGLITFVSPSPGPATRMDVYVRSELPNLALAPLGEIASLGLNGTERYLIANVRLPITALLFNQSSLVPGQRVAVGGPLNASNNPPTLTVRRVVLQRQGQQGTWVPGSTKIAAGNAGSFQLNDNFLAGVLLPSPVTVVTSNGTFFVNLGGLSDLSGTQPISLRVVGFVLQNPATGKPVIVARAVEKLR